MNTSNRPTFSRFVSLVALALLFTLVSEGETRAQDQREQVRKPRPREIKLIKDGRQNGYKCFQEGHENFVLLENVTDPKTKRTLEGEHDLTFKCKLGDIPLVKKLLFTNGRAAKVKTECLVLISPRIIINE